MELITDNYPDTPDWLVVVLTLVWGVPITVAFLTYAVNQESKNNVSQERSTPKNPTRKPIPKDVKMYVWQRDQGRCVECGSKERLEYDHIIPVSKGGSNTDRNIQLLCEYCNRSKGSSIA